MNPAFAYIYDEFLADRRFERDLAFLETEVARRGIEGRIVRLAMFRQPKDIIRDLVNANVKNIIFVGNDLTLEKMMWFLPDVDATFGFLPVMPGSMIAGMLDIPNGAEAVNTLAARLIEWFDVGKINERYFFTEAVLPNTQASVDVEGQYRISPAHGGAIAIRNLAGISGQPGAAHPQDGRLEIVIQTKVRENGMKFWQKSVLSESHVFLTHGAIQSEKSVEVIVDGQPLHGAHFSLSIVPHKIRLITGKQKGWEPPREKKEVVPLARVTIS
ncbi:MAG TPA: hypothetical protein VFQ60_01150 [Patescibacteria group bacterium]|nr:hypothetical protein [Patescibacteria group bacterium]